MKRRKRRRMGEKWEKEEKEKKDLLSNSKEAGYHDVEDTAKAQTEQLGSEIQDHSFTHPGIKLYR